MIKVILIMSSMIGFAVTIYMVSKIVEWMNRK